MLHALPLKNGIEGPDRYKKGRLPVKAPLSATIRIRLLDFGDILLLMNHCYYLSS